MGKNGSLEERVNEHLERILRDYGTRPPYPTGGVTPCYDDTSLLPYPTGGIRPCYRDSTGGIKPCYERIHPR